MPPRLAIAADRLAAKLLQPSTTPTLPPPIPTRSRARATLPPPFMGQGFEREEPTAQRLVTERDGLVPLADPPEATGQAHAIAAPDLNIAPELADDSTDDTIPIISHRGELDDSWFEILPWETEVRAPTEDGTEIVDASANQRRAADRRKRLFAGSLVGVATIAFIIGAAVSARSNGIGASAAGADQDQPEVATTENQVTATATEPGVPPAEPLVTALPAAADGVPATDGVPAAESEVAAPVDDATLAALDALASDTDNGDGLDDAVTTADPIDEPDPSEASEPEPAAAPVAEPDPVAERAKAKRRSKAAKTKSASRKKRAVTTKKSKRSAPRVAQSGGRGTLMIGAKPPCRIYVDGEFVGITPQRALRLPAGSHKVILRNKEHKIRKQLSVNIQAGKKTKVIRDYM